MNMFDMPLELITVLIDNVTADRRILTCLDLYMLYYTLS